MEMNKQQIGGVFVTLLGIWFMLPVSPIIMLSSSPTVNVIMITITLGIGIFIAGIYLCLRGSFHKHNG